MLDRPTAYGAFFLYPTYSPDDSGYYVEVVNRLGATVHTTSTFSTSGRAKTEARKWVESYYTTKKITEGDTTK